MEWLFVIGLMLLGIIIIILEVIFVPGTTVVGILGFLVGVYGIYLGYDYFGSSTGHYILVSGALATGVALVLAFKSGAWERFSLKGSITGKVNEGRQNIVKPGDIGDSVSALRPIGKALFDGTEFEVRTDGDYIRENQKVQVMRITDHKIFVKPLI